MGSEDRFFYGSPTVYPNERSVWFVGGEKSRHVEVSSGVPQSTVLGPLLLLCHINDLPERVDSQIRFFADDCLLYRPINSMKDHQILHQDLNNLQKWATDWGMKLTPRNATFSAPKSSQASSTQLTTRYLNKFRTTPTWALLSPTT